MSFFIKAAGLKKKKAPTTQNGKTLIITYQAVKPSLAVACCFILTALSASISYHDIRGRIKQLTHF